MQNAKRAQERLVAAGRVIKVDGDFGGESIAALMAFIANKPLTKLHTDLGEAAAKHFPSASINTPLRLAHVLAQQSVETGGFSTLVENLNYRVEALKTLFNSRTIRISPADCDRLGRKTGEGALSMARQRDIANLVYGGDWGKANLGNTQAGDGWTYRGRGAKQTTGRKNYADVKAVTGLDVLAKPELLEQPDTGMKAAAIFWKSKNCNPMADADDIRELTKRINGGSNGLAERTAALVRAKKILL